VAGHPVTLSRQTSKEIPVSSKQGKRQPEGWTDYEAYSAVRAELDVEPSKRAEAMAFLEPAIVAAAKRYAKQNHQAWPPHPAESGWRVTVWTW
jgi:hypothetical protein